MRISRRKKKHLRRIMPRCLLERPTPRSEWVTAWGVFNLGNHIPMDDPSWPIGSGREQVKKLR